MATNPSDPQPPRLVDYALAYARRAIPVFPCIARDKKPLTDHGLKDATTDAEQIQRWWKRWPRANIGIPTGERSGWLVVDIDTKANATYDTLAALGPLPTTMTAQTGSGGLHLIFRYPRNGTEVRNSTGKVAPGIDVRGEGGYIVAAPSIHPSGGAYEWVKEIEPTPCPSWLLKLMTATPEPSATRKAASTMVRLLTGDDDRDNYWLAWALEQAQPGTSDAAGYKLAQQLLTDPGVRDIDGTLAAYARMATFNTSDPFDEGDIDRWLKSAQASNIVRRGEPAKKKPRAQTVRPLPAKSARPKLHAVPSANDDEKFTNPITDFSRGGYEPPEEPAQLQRFPLTEMGNAERLFAAHGQDIRYSKAFGFCAWDGTRWRGDGELTIRKWAKETIRAMYAEAADLAQRASSTDDSVESKALASESVELMKWARKSETDRMIGAMLSLIRDMCEVDPSIFDARPMLLNVRNGTIDLHTGKLREHRREDYLMQRSPKDYDINASAPTFERFVRQIMCDRADLVDYLQRALGYTITGEVKEQVWHLLVGEGENGKGTLIETLSAILGEYAGMLEPESITVGGQTRDPNAPSPEMAGLKGKRLVKVTETEEGARIAAARIKRLSGADELRGRHLRHDLFSFNPTFKLWLYTNHRPQARETTHAFWRRVRYIPFDFNLREHPELKDEDLPKKLQAEAPGILAWLVRGCLAWQREGLKAPAVVLEATEAYKRDSDLLQMFLDENVEASGQGSTSARAVYGRYTTWCEEYGERPMSQRRLGEALSERGFQRTHMRSGWFWLNLQLTEKE